MNCPKHHVRMRFLNRDGKMRWFSCSRCPSILYVATDGRRGVEALPL